MNDAVKFLVISILIHIVILTLFLRIAFPVKKLTSPANTIDSYLFTGSKKTTPHDNVSFTRVGTETQQKVVVAGEQLNVSKQTKTNLIKEIHSTETHDKEIRRFSKMSPNKLTIDKSNADKDSNVLDNIDAYSAQFLEDLNAKKLNELSINEVREMRRPKPLIDNTKVESKRAYQKRLSRDFAPKGTSILVLAEYGPDEKTIIVGDNCMTVTRTDLNDKVYSGGSVYKFGGQACASYDKYFGQLDASLNKYLKK